MAVVTALGLRTALASSRSWLPIFAVAVIVALPVYGFVHVSDRYGEPYDFWAGRIRASLHLRADCLVATMEPTPCFLLYYSGRKGWWHEADIGRKSNPLLARPNSRRKTTG